MTAEEKRAEALWTYFISKERILRRLVEKKIMTQEDADDFANRMYEQSIWMRFRVLAFLIWVKRCEALTLV